MHHRLICQDCHSRSHTNTVISTQGSTFSGYPLTIDVRLDRVFLEVEDGIAEVWADPEFFEDLLKVFEEKGIPTDTAEVVRKPEMVTEITDASVARQVMRMIDRLEELDDVQNVTSNYELSDAVAEELENEE